ncbi:MAG: hypothetical protein ABSF88_00410 [Candidatus Aminicenantales bacterium]
MPQFKATEDGGLEIDGRKVLKAWESFSGWYLFGFEIAETRTPGKDGGGSMIDGREVPDVIWFGLVQGFEEELGYFSEAELKAAAPRVWQIKPRDLPYAGRK